MATLSDKGRLRVIDVVTGDDIMTLDASGIDDASIAFAPDRDHVLVAGNVERHGLLRTWNVATKSRGSDVALSEYLAGTGVSANGRFLCIQVGETFRVREMTSAKEVALQSEHGLSHVYPCTVSNDGKTMASGGQSSIRLWDVDKAKQTFKEEGNFGSIFNFAFADDGKSVVCAGWPPSSWDVATGKKTVLSSKGPPSYHNGTAASPSAFAFADEDAVHVIQPHGAVVTCPTEEAYEPQVVEFSHDGKLLACELRDGSVRIYDTATWAERGRAKVATEWDHVAMRFTDDDKSLKVLCNTDLVTFDTQTGATTATVKLKHPTKTLVGDSSLEPHAARVPVLFDDGTFAVHPWLGGVALYDASGAWVRDLKIPKADRMDAISHDGKTFAEFIDGTVAIMDVPSGTTRKVPVSVKSVWKLGLTPDAGAVIVEGYEGATVVVTDTDAQTSDAGARFVGRDALVPAQPIATLVYEGEGVLATLPSGAFEIRGKVSAICVVGSIVLERATCEDRATDGVIATWIEQMKGGSR